MDVKELLTSLAEFDEMEAPDGMNITEAEIKDDLMGEKMVSCELGNFNISVVCKTDGIRFGIVTEGTQAKIYKTSDEVTADGLAQTQEELLAAVEEGLNALEDKVIGILNARGYRA